MKTLTKRFCFSLFFILMFFISSAQFDVEKTRLIGLTFGTEYLHKNGTGAKFSKTIGLFGQRYLKFGITSHSSLFFAQRTYQVNQENTQATFFLRNFPAVAFPGLVLNRTSDFRENALNLDQFFKIHFPKGRISYFLGCGFFYKIPLSAYGQIATSFVLNQGEVEEFKFERKGLPNVWGFNIGSGGEFLFYKNYVISIQLGINIYSLDNIRFYQVPGDDWEPIKSDAHNIYLKMGVGYIFNKKKKMEKKPRQRSFRL